MRLELDEPELAQALLEPKPAFQQAEAALKAEALVLLARAHQQQGETEAALLVAQRCTLLYLGFPNRAAEACLLSAQLLMELNRPEAALETLLEHKRLSQLGTLPPLTEDAHGLLKELEWQLNK